MVGRASIPLLETGGNEQIATEIEISSTWLIALYCIAFILLFVSMPQVVNWDENYDKMESKFC